MPLEILKRILGHEKITTTSIYIGNSGLDDLAKYKPNN
jgi:hypothetical protein